MKLGLRKVSLTKSLKANTTGKIKRSIKSYINPAYGKKGIGLIRSPKKAIYNKVYNKTTIGINDLASNKNNAINKTNNNTIYKALDANKVIIGGNIYTKKNVNIFKNTFLILSIISFLLVVTFPLGILMLMLYKKYKNIYNEMEKY